jgi:hypothetical protein
MTSLEEADGVLEAALSFVDAFELDAVSPPPSQTLALSTANRPPSKEEKRLLRAEKKRLLRRAGVYSDPNRARNEQTRELSFLREQMEKLQLDLQVLQRQRNNQTPKSTRASTGGAGTVVPVRFSLWQEQATRQRRRREQAECDNVRLRLAVERQRKVADSLGVLVRKRTRQLVRRGAGRVWGAPADLQCALCGY